MKTAYLFFLILIITVSGLYAGRNAKFDNLGDQTWLDVCAFDGYPTDNGGAAEVL